MTVTPRLSALPRATGASRILIAAAAGLAMSSTASAATRTYTPAEATNTTGAPDLWSAGPAAGWDLTPASAADTTLVLNVPTTTGVTRFTSNDVANPFQLNVLTFQGTGPAGNSAASTLTVQGNALSFVSNGATAPVVNLNAGRGATGTPTPTLTVNVNNPLTLNGATTFQGNGTATMFNFAGAIGGAGPLTKTGASLMQISSATNNYTGATNVSGGTLQIGVSNVIPDASPVNVSGSGLLNFVGRNETLSTLSISDTGTVNSLSGIVTISGAMTNTSTSVGGSGAAFVVNSAGRVAIGGLATFGEGSQSLMGGGGGTRLTLGGGLDMTGSRFRLNTGSDSKITLSGDVASHPSSVTSGFVNNAAGTLTNTLDLGGATRTFAVENGAAATDFTVEAVVANGGVSKTGGGVMALTNPNNTYAGGTSVAAFGTLAARANGALGTGDVSLGNNAILDLSDLAVTTGAIADTATLNIPNLALGAPQISFGANTLNEIVGRLTVRGFDQPMGTYNASNSPFITGSGSITVVPEPGSFAAAGTLLGLAAVRRRRRPA